MDRAVYACCASEDCDSLEGKLGSFHLHICIEGIGARIVVHLDRFVQLVVECWAVRATEAVPEEQEEETAKEEGD